MGGEGVGVVDTLPSKYSICELLQSLTNHLQAPLHLSKGCELLFLSLLQADLFIISLLHNAS